MKELFIRFLELIKKGWAGNPEIAREVYNMIPQVKEEFEKLSIDYPGVDGPLRTIMLSELGDLPDEVKKFVILGDILDPEHKDAGTAAEGINAITNTLELDSEVIRREFEDIAA